MLLATAGCDSAKSDASDTKASQAKGSDKASEKAQSKPDAKPDSKPDAKVAAAEPKAEPAADGLDPSLDNAGLDDTGKAIAKLFDASRTCAFDMNSQIRGCKPYDEFRAMQRKISPMTKAFSGQRDLVVRTRLKSQSPTVRAWSYNLSRGAYRDNTELRTALEAALSAETDTVALLVGLRAVRGQLKANESLKPVFDKHAKSAVKEVAETAQQAIDKAAG